MSTFEREEKRGGGGERFERECDMKRTHVAVL